MTEHQAQSPIDDLFRKTFENLPDTPAESGWDTPSDRVWQNVQTNIQAPRQGWSMLSILLASVPVLATIAALVYFWTAPVQQPPVVAPIVTPVEQPAISPAAPAESTENQAITAPNPSTGNNTAKETPSKPKPRNSTEELQTKPNSNGAQPLPGSKQTLPPNSTEAQKKQGENK